jgi:alkanesulfonate monooxygenase SsuD/methylene tetrahydromethanopterin reductase-like flavin-dependent oxidoreductase (luciferase family)
MVPAVIILPQRQTALVAKQAAEVNILTNGKIRLGVGVGWNPVEYEALGGDTEALLLQVGDGTLLQGTEPIH